MRKLLLLFVFIQITIVVSAQVSIRVDVDAPGGLSYAIIAVGGNLTAITNLTVTGTIDARDFKTMRDNMPSLTVVDLNSVIIEAYNGMRGTAEAGSMGNIIESSALAGRFNENGSALGPNYPAKTIPQEAFSNHSIPEKDSRFTFITIPSTATAIGGNAFYRCNRLTSVTIPDKVTNISNNAFYGCSGLTSVTLSGQVTNIGVAAFSGCSSLTSITIPQSLISIGNAAFSGTNIVFKVDNNNTKYSSIDGVLFNKTQTKLIQCPISKKGSYSIPNTVNSLGVGAFQHCKDLSEITIPNSVSSIEASAFYGCSGLTTILIPNSVTSIGAWAFYSCSGMTSVTIPNSVTSILDCAFQGCSRLTSVTLPNAITSIRQNVFQDCSSLTSVTFPESVSSIGMFSFWGCSALTTVSFPTSVKSIGRMAFSNCTGLKTITIPGSLADIGPYAFDGCSALYSVDKNNAAYSSSDGILFDKTQTTLIRCPTSKNGNYFIPNTVTSIDNGAFVECSLLLTVAIHKNVKLIVGNPFSCCSAIISVDQENHNYSDVDGILFDKNQKKIIHCPISRNGSYSIPNSVILIGGSAFEKCAGLTSIIIPKSVTSMGASCFNDCTLLTSITVKSSSPVELSSFLSVFNKIDQKTCKLYVPFGSKPLYQAANQWKDFENIEEAKLN